MQKPRDNLVKKHHQLQIVTDMKYILLYSACIPYCTQGLLLKLAFVEKEHA